MSFFRGLALAFGFLSRVPMPQLASARRADFAWALFWFPGVGLVLSAALMGAAWGLLKMSLPSEVSAALLLTLWVGLTGGLHLDGVADTADGLSGGRDRATRLAIMRDSRIGAHGAVAIVLVLVLKYALLSALFDVLVSALLSHGVQAVAERVPVLARGLALAVAAPRLVVVVALAWFEYARPEGLGAAFKQAAHPALPLLGSAWVLALVLFPSPQLGLCWVLGAVLCLALAAVRQMSVALGGLTGDAYGAAIEGAEVLCLLGLVIATSVA